MTENVTNVMTNHSQQINIVFNYTTSFELSITLTTFDVFNQTATDLGKVKFDINVYCCTSNKNNCKDIVVEDQGFNLQDFAGLKRSAIHKIQESL